MKIKTSELLGDPLDFAVAKAIGAPISRRSGGMICDGEVVLMAPCGQKVWSPSTDWSQAGPLIEKFHMDFCCEHPETIGAALCDENGMYIDNRMMFGKTHLIASCRAIVSAKLGDEVEVPEELL